MKSTSPWGCCAMLCKRSSHVNNSKNNDSHASRQFSARSRHIFRCACPYVRMARLVGAGGLSWRRRRPQMVAVVLLTTSACHAASPSTPVCQRKAKKIERASVMRADVRACGVRRAAGKPHLGRGLGHLDLACHLSLRRFRRSDARAQAGLLVQALLDLGLQPLHLLLRDLVLLEHPLALRPDLQQRGGMCNRAAGPLPATCKAIMPCIMHASLTWST